jgi:CRP-like cAMP-binding protein
MPTACLDALAHLASQANFKAGTLLFREGEPANRFYLLETGTISVQTHSAGRPLTVQTIDPGEVLGWSWLFPPFFWHFDARADGDTSAIMFDAPALRLACERDPALGYEVMKRMAEVVAQRLQSTRQKLVMSAKPETLQEMRVGG